MYYITEHGKNIRIAQYAFLLLYLLTLIVVFAIYQKSLKVSAIKSIPISILSSCPESVFFFAMCDIEYHLN